MHRSGEGVRRDYGEALKWLMRAAKNGYGRSHWQLAEMYSNGDGVPQDYIEAHKWFNIAAARLNSSEDTEARELVIRRREIVSGMMTPAQIAEAQKRASEWRPAHEPSNSVKD